MSGSWFSLQMALLCISPIVLLGHLSLAIFTYIKNSINVYQKRKVAGQRARWIAVILLLGGVLSPFTFSISGFVTIVIAIVIGLLSPVSEPQIQSVHLHPGQVKVGDFVIVQQPNQENPSLRPVMTDQGTEPTSANSSIEDVRPLHDSKTREPVPAASVRRGRSDLPDTWMPESDQPHAAPARRAGIPAQDMQARKESSDAFPISQPSSTTKAWLEVVQGNLKQDSVPIQVIDFLIGRGREMHLQLQDINVSRKHARLRYAGERWYIQDQNSTSGILLNGQKIYASRVESGDEITIASFVFIFHTD